MRLGDFPLRHLLTPAQAARYLGVAPATLTTWREMGIGPACILYEFDPGIIRYDLGAIDDWMAANARVLCAPHGTTVRLTDRTVEVRS
jgi:hypothetical protein